MQTFRINFLKKFSSWQKLSTPQLYTFVLSDLTLKTNTENNKSEISPENSPTVDYSQKPSAFFLELKFRTLNEEKTLEFLKNLNAEKDTNNILRSDYKNYLTLIQVIFGKLREAKKEFFSRFENDIQSKNLSQKKPSKKDILISQICFELLKNIAFAVNRKRSNLTDILERTVNSCCFFICEFSETFSKEELISVIEYINFCCQTSVKCYYLIIMQLKNQISELSSDEAARILYFLQIRQMSFLQKKDMQKKLIHSDFDKTESQFNSVISILFTIYVTKSSRFVVGIVDQILTNVQNIKQY